MDERIRITRAEGIGTITINRPEQHNAMSFEMWGALGEAARDLSSDDAVKVVVVTGAGGKAFSAGADIKDFPEHRSSSSLAREYAVAFEGSMDVLEEMPKPVIAMIRGICVGGGCELATATDVRIAAEGSTFGVPIAKIGVLAGYKETRRLVQLVGVGNAKHILLTAKTVNAQEALRIGLVSEVVPDNRLEDHTYELAARMAHYAPLSQAGHKRILRTVLDKPSLQGLTPDEVALPLAIFDSDELLSLDAYQSGGAVDHKWDGVREAIMRQRRERDTATD